MPWTNPVDPVTNTVITVAYAISNLTGPLRWLRLMTGNADPPASNYLVTSDSAGATSWKTGLAAIQAVLGYAPVSKAGDVMSGDLTVQRAAAPTTGAVFFGNSGAVVIFDDGATLQILGLPVHIAQALAGGVQTAGVLNLLGLNVGNQGVSNGGPYGGGSLTVGPTQTLFRGLSVGAQGIASSGQIAANGSLVASSITSNGQIASTVAGGGAAPITVTSTTYCPNLCANLLADQAGTGRYATSVPAGNAIPVADASGTLNAWVSTTAAAPMPSNGVIGFDAPIATIPSGWTRFSVADGRLLVGDSNGPLNGQTFQAGLSYPTSGVSWGHAHATSWSSHTHGSSALSVAGSTGGPSATRSDMNTITPGASVANDSHSHGVGTLDVGGSTDAAGGGGTSSDTWLPPMRAIFWIKKT